LKEHIQDKGYAPSIAEIGKQFKLSSPATVHKHLVHLESKGLIRKHQNQSRAIEIVSERSKNITPKEYKGLDLIVASKSIEVLENRDMDLRNKELLKEFPVKTSRIFFDHAKVSPLPRRVCEAVNEFTNDACRNGTKNYKKWMEEVERVRGKFALLINGDVDEVAFIKNTSEGISIVANGLDWKSGDNVVIPDIEFPANVYPWWNLKRFGVETRMVKSKDGRVVFDDLIEQTDKRTRIVSVSSVECNSGFRNDLKRIGAFCRENSILFCVDAIQSLGVLEIDVKRDNIDFLSADGHKWMLSVEGLGGFYISKNVLEKIYPVTVGWDSVVNAWDFMNYDFTFRPDAKRFEEGSFNTMSIYALGAALDLLEDIGIDSIQSGVLLQGDYLMEGLQKRGIKILNSRLKKERSGIISYEMKSDPEIFSSYMIENNISLTVRNGLVRLSPHFYNGYDEADRFFDLIDSFSKFKTTGK
jgi:selenocysteine lyase/cysteine desulfurase